MDSLIFELQIVFYFQLFLSANVRHSFVAKHNLSKAAWTDLLRLPTVPSRRAVSKNFSVSL